MRIDIVCFMDALQESPVRFFVERLIGGFKRGEDRAAYYRHSKGQAVTDNRYGIKYAGGFVRKKADGDTCAAGGSAYAAGGQAARQEIPESAAKLIFSEDGDFVKVFGGFNLVRPDAGLFEYFFIVFYVVKAVMNKGS
jgi:hypothetical protein